MNKLYPSIILSLGLMVASITPSNGTTNAIAAPEDARAEALLYQLEQDCGSCHGLTLKGGLGPALLPENLTEKDDEILVNTILNGRPGTPMPPWQFEISEQEAQWLVQILKEGLK